MEEDAPENFALVFRDRNPADQTAAFQPPPEDSDPSIWQYHDPGATANDDVDFDPDSFTKSCDYYEKHFTCKELLLIANYYAPYGLPATCNAKTPKWSLITNIVEFEQNPLNSEVVERRQTFWFYMCELQQDKFMAKYVHGPFFRF